MDQEIRGKTALITGATSGIGRATALRFAEAGCSLAIVGRNETALADIAREIGAKGGEVLAIKADVTCPEDAQRSVDETLKTYKALDILVNAAGHISTGSIENTTLAAWDAMLNVNLRAVFHLMQTCVPYLAVRRGNVVNVSSVTGLRAFPNILAYCVSKAALDQLTRCAALELAAKGVRVNAVNPGVVVTEIHKRGGMDDRDYAAFLEHSKTTHPIGRVGDAREISDLILYLASERAAWITGVTYSIDGGRAQTCAR